MRALLRTGPLLLALGVFASGCAESGAPTKAASKPAKTETTVASSTSTSSPAAADNSSKYVVKVEGMH